MNRRLIPYLGIALLAGLYFFDSRQRTERLLPATLLSIEDRDDSAGPDSWHMQARTSTGEVALAPIKHYPSLRIGDRICVTKITRPRGEPVFRWSPQSSC